MPTSTNHVPQKAKYSLSRYLGPEGKIALRDMLPQETK